MIWFVVTHYRLPPERLQDFLVWNDKSFRSVSARLLVVMDQPLLRLPDYACAAVFPKKMERFALSWTSNFGIRTAINNGANIVCKTDPDMLITEDLAAILASVQSKTAVSPVYRMAQGPNEARQRPESCLVWDGSRGTFAMNSGDWRAVSGYDQRMVGYGPEDGDLCDRCKREKIKIFRHSDSPIFHIAHDPGTPQKKGQRFDQWGRDDGFNAENRPEINALRRLNNWDDPSWGKF